MPETLSIKLNEPPRLALKFHTGEPHCDKCKSNSLVPDTVCPDPFFTHHHVRSVNQQSNPNMVRIRMCVDMLVPDPKPAPTRAGSFVFRGAGGERG